MKIIWQGTYKGQSYRVVVTKRHGRRYQRLLSPNVWSDGGYRCEIEELLSHELLAEQRLAQLEEDVGK